MFLKDLKLIWLPPLLLCLTISLTAQDCTPEDCLWPGDANRNGVCNNMDLLWIGLATFSGGDARPDPSFSWTPQDPSIDWENSHPVSGINHKFADTDGNGFVSGADYNIFPSLYGQVNDQFTGFLGNEIPGDDLFLEFSNANPAPGETVEVSINLGSAGNPINDIYGIAFTIEFDTAVINEELTQFFNEGGWLDTPEANLYKSSKIDPILGLVHPEFAYVSQGETAQSGFGEICRMSIVIEDVIVGLDGQPADSVNLALAFKRVLGLNAFEEDLMITIENKELLVNTEQTLIPPRQPQVLTRQVGGHLIVSADRPIQQLSLVDMSGRIHSQWAPYRTELEMNTLGLPTGIYTLFVKTESGYFSYKIPLLE